MPRIDALTLKIKVNGEDKGLVFKRLASALEGMAKYVIKEARIELKNQDKVVSGDLYNSLYYKLNTGRDETTLEFEAGVPYWDFVNQGVKGVKDQSKAPESDYRFGTGNFSGQGTLRGGIDRWVIRKPIEGVRDAKTGRFIPRKQMVRMISNKIWNYGIAPSNYYTLALDRGWKTYKKRMAVAIGLDVSDFVTEHYEGDIDIEITI